MLYSADNNGFRSMFTTQLREGILKQCGGVHGGRRERGVVRLCYFLKCLGKEKKIHETIPF